MKVIPAIDIRGGKVVRLEQGRAGRMVTYYDYPLEVAQRWASYGVDMIHIVDLDGAFKGQLRNLDIVKKITAKIKPRVELGGGIRDEESIEQVFDAGVQKVVIGTKALDADFLKIITDRYGDRIVVSIDAKEGVVYTKGWLFGTKTEVTNLVKAIEDCGVRTINYTDISKDGMLAGPNMEELKAVLKNTKMDVIASGGVSNSDDLRRLKELEIDGLKGVIIGKALYENKIDLGEAINICK